MFRLVVFSLQLSLIYMAAIDYDGLEKQLKELDLPNEIDDLMNLIDMVKNNMFKHENEINKKSQRNHATDIKSTTLQGTIHSTHEIVTETKSVSNTDKTPTLSGKSSADEVKTDAPGSNTHHNGSGSTSHSGEKSTEKSKTDTSVSVTSSKETPTSTKQSLSTTVVHVSEGSSTRNQGNSTVSLSHASSTTPSTPKRETLPSEVTGPSTFKVTEKSSTHHSETVTKLATDSTSINTGKSTNNVKITDSSGSSSVKTITDTSGSTTDSKEGVSASTTPKSTSISPTSTAVTENQSPTQSQPSTSPASSAEPVASSSSSKSSPTISNPSASVSTDVSIHSSSMKSSTINNHHTESSVNTPEVSTTERNSSSTSTKSGSLGTTNDGTSKTSTNSLTSSLHNWSSSPTGTTETITDTVKTGTDNHVSTTSGTQAPTADHIEIIKAPIKAGTYWCGAPEVTFTAIRTSKISTPANPVSFDQILANIGSAFSNSKFTAPFSGLYSFQLDFEYSKTETPVYLELKHDNIVILKRRLSSGSECTGHSLKVDLTLHMMKGTKLWVEVNGDVSQVDGAYHVFSGKLLLKDM